MYCHRLRRYETKKVALMFEMGQGCWSMRVCTLETSERVGGG